MSVIASLDRLRSWALALPRDGCDWEDRPIFTPPTPPHTIAALESVAGFTLPPDVRLFLEQTDCIVGMSVHNGYCIGGSSQILSSFSNAAIPALVEGEPVITIASDGGGNLFLIGRNANVWQWNHETGNVLTISESFDTFLQRVADDWEAYLLGTRGWHFLV